MSLSSVAAVFRRIPRWVYIVLAVLLVIATAVVVPRIATHRKIEAEIAASREAGWPVTLEELNASYKYPAGANAADILNSAFTRYDDSKSDGIPLVDVVSLPAVGQPLPPEMKAKMAAYLLANAAALELLHKGAAIPVCRWPVDLRGGLATGLLRLAPFRQGARLLSLEAEAAADDNKPDEAAGALAASLGLARSLRTHPLLISQFLRYALHSMSSEGLNRVLSRIPLPEAQLLELSCLAEEEERAANLERTLAAEACLMNAFYEGSWGDIQKLRQGWAQLQEIGQTKRSGAGTEEQIKFFVYFHGGEMQRDQLACLQFMRQMIQAAKHRPSAMIAEMRPLEAEYRSLLKERSSVSLMRMSLIGWLWPAVAYARDLAGLRAMRAALAVERFRLAHAKLPEKLDELVPDFLPEVPADPFDDKPLRYVRREKGYMIYSVGENKKDEGGAEHKPGAVSGSGNIPFRVER